MIRLSVLLSWTNHPIAYLSIVCCLLMIFVSFCLVVVSVRHRLTFSRALSNLRKWILSHVILDGVFLNRHHFHVFLFFLTICAYDLSCGAAVVVVVHAAAAADVLVSNVDVASAAVVVVRVVVAADASFSDVVADLVDVVAAALMMFVSHPWRCVLVNPAIPNSHFSPSMLL